MYSRKVYFTFVTESGRIVDNQQRKSFITMIVKQFW